MKPVLQALVLAERVYTDKTGKKIIAGTFNLIKYRVQQAAVRPETLPDGSAAQVIDGGADLGSPTVYISVTDVVDGTIVTVQFVNIALNKILFGADFRLHCKNRLQTIELVAPLPSLDRFLRIDGPGTYAIEIVCEGEILGSHRVLVAEQTNAS